MPATSRSPTSKLGDLHRGLGHGEQARSSTRRSSKFAEELHRRNPSRPISPATSRSATTELGDLHRGLGHGEQALEFYEKALATSPKSFAGATRNSADFARDLSVSYNRHGRSSPRPGARGAGPGVLREGARHSEKSFTGATRSSADFARDLSVTYTKLGDLHLGLGHGEQALAFYREGARNSQKSFTGATPTRPISPATSRSATSGWAICTSAWGTGEQALRVLREVTRNSPKSFTSATRSRPISPATSRSPTTRWAICTAAWGTGSRPWSSTRKSLAIAEELHRRNPQSADFARDLSVSLRYKMGDLHRGLGHRRAGPATFYRKSTSQFAEELHRRNPQLGRFRPRPLGQLLEDGADGGAERQAGHGLVAQSVRQARGDEAARRASAPDEPFLEAARAKLGQSPGARRQQY